MKYKFVSALVLCFLLAGCSAASAPAESPKADTPTTSDKTEVPNEVQNEPSTSDAAKDNQDNTSVSVQAPSDTLLLDATYALLDTYKINDSGLKSSQSWSIHTEQKNDKTLYVLIGKTATTPVSKVIFYQDTASQKVNCVFFLVTKHEYINKMSSL